MKYTQYFYSSSNESILAIGLHPEQYQDPQAVNRNTYMLHQFISNCVDLGFNAFLGVHEILRIGRLVLGQHAQHGAVPIQRYLDVDFGITCRRGI